MALPEANMNAVVFSELAWCFIYLFIYKTLQSWGQQTYSPFILPTTFQGRPDWERMTSQRSSGELHDLSVSMWLIATPNWCVSANLICGLRGFAQLLLVSAAPQNFIYFSSVSWTLITAEAELCKTPKGWCFFKQLGTMKSLTSSTGHNTGKLQNGSCAKARLELGLEVKLE